MFLRPVTSLLLVWVFIQIGFGPSAQATVFQNSYISFELPPNWDCKLDGTEWVCISQFAKQAKEAIIILTAKEVGPTDSNATYLNHLKTPKNLPDKSGKMIPSKVLHVKDRLISDHPWVDGMHLGSEIPSYYTRYLATVKDRLAILVTFSAHKEHYTKYSSDFLKAIDSLRVVAGKDMIQPKPQLTPVTGSHETIGVPIEALPTETGPADVPPAPANRDMKTNVFALALLLGAVGFYLWRKNRS